jgi:hypothetical protein
MKFLNKIIDYILLKRNGVIIYYSTPERSNVMRVINNIKKENTLLLAKNEAYQLFMAVKATQKIEEDIAEVGVYRGGSGKLICLAKKNKSLHLFDTFEGLPTPTSLDNTSQFHKGEYKASLESVKNYLKDCPNVEIYKGVFPLTAGPIKNKKFSLVHLDVDLYESTLNSLKFFYPRMNSGGVIISHDYPDSPGVKKAIVDFTKNKKSPIIEMSGSQCLIVKV